MAYNIGDIFIGCPASFTGRPYNQPTVLHYAADGTTLLHTLTVPVGPAVNEDYGIMGVAVGTDGRCYVVWETSGSVTPFVAEGNWLGVFDASGAWVTQLATLSTVQVFTQMFALPGGDLAFIHNDAGALTIERRQNDGTLVNSWSAPASGNFRGWALAPGTTEYALLLMSPDQAYVVSLLDGSAVGPVTVPYDAMSEDPHALLSSTTSPYLVIRDAAGSDDAWRIQQLSADMTATAGARAELATESFPGGGVSHFGLVNRPWDAAVNADGTAGWGVTLTEDTGHTGTSLDSIHRTYVRTTDIPGGTGSAVQSDVNGDSNLLYVFQGFAAVSTARYPYVSMVG